MSRSQRRRKGRPYQPLPPRRNSAWLIRLIVVMVGATLVIGSLALFGAMQ